MLEKVDIIPSKLIKVAESSVHMQILANDSQSIIDIFEKLYWELNPEAFMKLFRLCLTDNGSEFSNPLAIEFDRAGNRRTHLFYCAPSAPHQKGAAENNHELIRRILPKGTSFNNYI